MASTFHFPSPPQSLLSPPFHSPPKLSLTSSTLSPSLSVSKFNHKLSFLTSAAQSLPNPQISPFKQHTYLPFSPSDHNLDFLSSNDIHKCSELLRLSVRYGDFELARAVHCLILKFEEDNYLSNSLITAYLSLGLISDAYSVFTCISDPDVVSYTAIISCFAKSGLEIEAIELYLSMIDSCIDPNEFTFVALLTASGRILDLQLGFQVHCLVVKLGYLSNTYVANALMGLYSKCGCFDNVLKVFDEMPERDIASWNTIISVVLGEVMYERTFELFQEMQRIDGFRVDQYTLSSLLSGCAGCYARISGREIHAHGLRLGFENNLSVNNALIGFYAQCGSSKDVQALFVRMPTKDVITWTGMITAYMKFGMVGLAMEVFAKTPMRNHVSYNAVLAGLCENGEGLEALSLFVRMVTDGIELTEQTLTSAIGASGLVEDKNICKQIHGFVIKFGFGPNAHIEAALLDMCTRCGRMNDAQLMFYESQYNQNLPINWTSLICGYARDSQPEEAIALFQWGQSEEGLVVDDVVVSVVLGICGTLGFYGMGKQMHCHALKSGYCHDLGVGNAIISMYSKCGFVKDAVEVFDFLPMHDVVSWNSLIGGYLLQRQGDKALIVWSRMNLSSIRPDSITFVLVISSYKHTKSNMLDDCRRLFLSMESEYDVKHTSDHYASFVSVLGHWGSLEEAEDMITKMPFEPKVSVWRALLHSCTIHKNSVLGKRIVKRALAMEPQDPSTFILKSNLFSASGRWHCSEIVREEMRKKGLRKHPSRCWMVNQNIVHRFFTRDESHSRSKDIYRGLEILILECLKAGYVPDTSYVLHEVEEHQKKEFLFHHSAKLAVTYGLLMTRPGKPIRVTKNVLLCGDCHNFFKYVSVVTRREICVRDTSGFHCFSNGKCSCRDHW